GAAIGRHPALAPQPDRRRLDDQILDDEILVPFEAGAHRDLGLDDPILDHHPRQRLLAAPTPLAVAAPRRLLLARPFHAARFAGLDVRSALQPLEPGNLVALLSDQLLLLGDDLLQRRHLAEQA